MLTIWRRQRLSWGMVTYHQVRDVLEAALEQHGPDARALAVAVAELVPLDQHTTVYEVVFDKLRTGVWPQPRCACDLARTAWRALPLGVRRARIHEG